MSGKLNAVFITPFIDPAHKVLAEKLGNQFPESESGFFSGFLVNKQVAKLGYKAFTVLLLILVV